MNFDGDLIKLGEYDITDLKRYVMSYTEDKWNENDIRQKRFETHKDTTSIPLIFDEDFRHTNPTKLEEYYNAESLLLPIYARINVHFKKSMKYKRLQEKHGNAYVVRSLFARLRPGGSIPKHMDRNHSLSHGHRIHIPLVSDASVAFSVGSGSRYLKEGEIWEVNNRHEHHVENNSDIYRIHLIVDWAIPGERCCCSKHANPRGVCSPDACKPFDFRGDPCTCFAP
jgi:hypothetical protein